MFLDETEFRQVQAVGSGGPVLPLDDGRDTTFQGAQALAALQLAFQVGAELLVPLGDQGEAAPDLSLGLGELPPGEQRLAQRPMGLGELRFQPDGFAEVVDGFRQSEFALRRDAERVPGRDPPGITVVCLPIMSHPLCQGLTTGLGEGLDALRVEVVSLVPASRGDQGDAE